MNELVSIIQEFFTSITIRDWINILLSAMIGVSVFAYLSIRRNFNAKQSLIKQRKKEGFLKKIQKETTKNRLQMATEDYFQFRNTKYTAKQFYIAILSIIFSFLIFFIINKNILFAIVFPLVIYIFSILLLKIKVIRMKDIFSEQMPAVINNTIKILSRHEDMKTVIFELSQDLKEPVRGHFLSLSRRMVTVAYDDVLLEFAQKIDSMWLYAYVFLLMNYKKESKKSDIIVNLRILSKMLEEENIAQNKKLAERQGLVIMNYALSSLAIIGFLGNLTFNDNASDYFFNSVGGMYAFVFGMIAILCTIYVNIKLTKREYR